MDSSFWKKINKKEESREEWVHFSEVHTAYCQQSIEEIIERLNYVRGISKKPPVKIKFNVDSGKVEICTKEDLVAEVYMDGDSGFPSNIVVVNYNLLNGLTEQEMKEFKCVRDSRSSFRLWIFDLMIKQIKQIKQ